VGVKGWVWLVLGAAVVALMSWAVLTGNDGAASTVYWVVLGVVLLLVVWRVVRAVLRPGESARAVVAPGMQGLAEVQDLYLGRQPVGPVAFGDEAGPVAELVVDRPDPLDEQVWRV
jgi:membrane protein implicated in regulation of membrane protease activity